MTASNEQYRENSSEKVQCHDRTSDETSLAGEQQTLTVYFFLDPTEAERTITKEESFSFLEITKCVEHEFPAIAADVFLGMPTAQTAKRQLPIAGANTHPYLIVFFSTCAAEKLSFKI